VAGSGRTWYVPQRTVAAIMAAMAMLWPACAVVAAMAKPLLARATQWLQRSATYVTVAVMTKKLGQHIQATVKQGI
jgi:hypothetical protein